MTAPKWLRVRLVLAAKSRARHVECLHYADDKPFLFEDRWINLAAVPRTENADLTAIGPNEWLVGEVPYTNAEVRFSAATADEPVARFLETRSGAPPFLVERTTWLSETPVTNVHLHFASGYQMVARY